MRLLTSLVLLLELALLAFAAAPCRALDFEEKVVAGGAGDFMEVRHLELRGSNVEIGRKLAEIARDRHGAVLAPAADRLKARVLERYLARNFPVHHARMRGAAAAYGLSAPGGGAIDFTGLFYNLDLPHLPRPQGGGCSVVFYPPGHTTLGAGVLSRNYDFTTGTLGGQVPAAGQPAATSRPYVLELHPDEGYASLAVCAYDLIGGAIDGINSEGLCVALMADDESMATRPMEPAMGAEVGLYELNIPRFLLDNCASCEEAKEMLLAARHYYAFCPLHYIVADRHGNSFVWEYSYSKNKEYVIDGGGAPQVVTNHPLHRWPRIDDLPAPAEAEIDSYERYRTLTARIQAAGGRMSLARIKETNACVAAAGADPPPPGRARHRTLWHALYYPEERRAEIDFYLGDRPDPERPGQSRIARSGYLGFRLQGRR